MTADPLTSRRRYTLEEYLAYEESVPTKHEFNDGEILAMSGASPEHALITANLIREVGNRLKGKPCRAYSSDLKIGVPPTHQVLYPDGSIVCGPLEYYPDEPKQRIVSNAKVIFEVSSPSTVFYDRADKYVKYREIPSLQEYVLISQQRPLVEVLARQTDGRWTIGGVYIGMEAVLQLPSVQIEIPLAEIYADVEFPPLPLPD
jgi:Uma2 family endonuclease